MSIDDNVEKEIESKRLQEMHNQGEKDAKEWLKNTEGHPITRALSRPSYYGGSLADYTLDILGFGSSIEEREAYDKGFRNTENQ